MYVDILGDGLNYLKIVESEKLEKMCGFAGTLSPRMSSFLL